MPTPDEIADLSESPTPPGADPFVIPERRQQVAVVPADPAWPNLFAEVAERITEALGPKALLITHIGSTSVPGLAAKPVIDVDLIVADPAEESAWLPSLRAEGFVLAVREPWWHEHRCLALDIPRANVHVFGPDSPEPWRHRIMRDHLRRTPADRQRYEEAKLAAAGADGLVQTVMDYNRRKEAIVHEILRRALGSGGFRTD